MSSKQFQAGKPLQTRQPVHQPHIDFKKNQKSGDKRPFTPNLPPLIQRAAQVPQSITPAEAAYLQHTVGNQALGRMLRVQAKMTVGSVGDKYEQEADAVAKRVVQNINAPQPQIAQRQEDDDELQLKPFMPILPHLPFLQRQEEEEEELQMEPAPELQRQEDEEELQMKSTMEGGELSSDIESQIQSAKGGGRPLSPHIRTPMERGFGTDFSGVKIHTGSQSNQLNQSIQARAFTTGRDIFFRDGAYNPNNSAGQELLAHELTHVVQQNGGTPNTARRQEEEEVQMMPDAPVTQRQEEEEEVLQAKPLVQPTSDSVYGRVQRALADDDKATIGTYQFNVHKNLYNALKSRTRNKIARKPETEVEAAAKEAVRKKLGIGTGLWTALAGSQADILAESSVDDAKAKAGTTIGISDPTLWNSINQPHTSYFLKNFNFLKKGVLNSSDIAAAQRKAANRLGINGRLWDTLSNQAAILSAANVTAAQREAATTGLSINTVLWTAANNKNTVLAQNSKNKALQKAALGIGISANSWDQLNNKSTVLQCGSLEDARKEAVSGGTTVGQGHQPTTTTGLDIHENLFSEDSERQAILKSKKALQEAASLIGINPSLWKTLSNQEAILKKATKAVAWIEAATNGLGINRTLWTTDSPNGIKNKQADILTQTSKTKALRETGTAVGIKSGLWKALTNKTAILGKGNVSAAQQETAVNGLGINATLWTTDAPDGIKDQQAAIITQNGKTLALAKAGEAVGLKAGLWRALGNKSTILEKTTIAAAQTEAATNARGLGINATLWIAASPHGIKASQADIITQENKAASLEKAATAIEISVGLWKQLKNKRAILQQTTAALAQKEAVAPVIVDEAQWNRFPPNVKKSIVGASNKPEARTTVQLQQWRSNPSYTSTGPATATLGTHETPGTLNKIEDGTEIVEGIGEPIVGTAGDGLGGTTDLLDALNKRYYDENSGGLKTASGITDIGSSVADIFGGIAEIPLGIIGIASGIKEMREANGGEKIEKLLINVLAEGGVNTVAGAGKAIMGVGGIITKAGAMGGSTGWETAKNIVGTIAGSLGALKDGWDTGIGVVKTIILIAKSIRMKGGGGFGIAAQIGETLKSLLATINGVGDIVKNVLDTVKALTDVAGLVFSLVSSVINLISAGVGIIMEIVRIVKLGIMLHKSKKRKEKLERDPDASDEMFQHLIRINQKRIKRMGWLIAQRSSVIVAEVGSGIASIVTIIANIVGLATSPTGFGAAGGAVVATVSNLAGGLWNGIIKIGGSMVKGIWKGVLAIRQYGRNKGWDGHNQEKTSTKKHDKRVASTVAIMGKVHNLVATTPTQADYAKSHLLLESTGVDVKKLFALNGSANAPVEQGKMLVEAMKQRDEIPFV